MSKTEIGVLILNEWYEAMRGLNKADFYKLMMAMYEYQILGKDPPVFEGKAAGIAKVIFAQLDRRIAFIQSGKLGAAKRLEGKQTAGCEAADPLSDPSSPPSSQSESPLGVKENKIKEKQIKYISSSPHYSAEKRARTVRGGGAHSATLRGEGGGNTGQTAQGDGFWDGFSEYALKKALGEIDQET